MTPWVLRLIIANVVVYVLRQLRPAMVEVFAFTPMFAIVQPWSIITYMFLHGGLTHILFNMLGLFFFGPRLEEELGSKHFLGLYFCSGIVGALLSFVTPNVSIIGASGALYGVMLGFAYYWPHERIFIYGVIPVPARTMVAVMTGLSLLGGFGGGDNIAHFAHLGGFVGGFLYLKLFVRRVFLVSHERIPQMVSEPSQAEIDSWKRIDREKLHEVNRAELDRILDKINGSGMESLTPQERGWLRRFSPQ